MVILKIDRSKLYVPSFRSDRDFKNVDNAFGKIQVTIGKAGASIDN